MLKRHYPDFDDFLGSIPDHRSRHTFQVAAIIMAGLSMFLFKRGSRNHADKTVTGHYERNYVTLFGYRLPVMDTVDAFLRNLPPGELERIKQVLISRLVGKRVLERWKFKGKYVVAVDGTGMYSFDKEPFPGCPHKTSKSGKKVWQAHVVEAKLLCANGLSLSLATQWLDNSEDMGDKQDCEQKAFLRLAKKIKKMYPRLPIIITADALYPNNTMFNLCRKNNWGYIFTFKEGVLKSVWEEIKLLYPLMEGSNKQEKTVPNGKKGWRKESIMHINNIYYKDHLLHWIEYEHGPVGSPPDARFVHLTNILIDKKTTWDISRTGRLRWKIENEGFNAQKNGGYRLQHKYSRTCFQAMQNYYQLLQIAHLINQLTEKLQKVEEAIKQAGTTWKAIYGDMVASMAKEIFCQDYIALALDNCRQLRY